MTKDEIVDKLRTLMKSTSREKVDWDALTENSTIASLGFDSLSILDLMYDLQQEFKIEFAPEEIANIKTVGELAGWLEKRLAG